MKNLSTLFLLVMCIITSAVIDDHLARVILVNIFLLIIFLLELLNVTGE